MEKIGRNRLIWEEILEDPFIYRIRESGSRDNAYLIVSGDEALAVDPRSAAMLRGIRMLCRGLGAEEGKLKLFLTSGCTDDRMEDMLQQLPAHTAVYSAFVPCEDTEDEIKTGGGDITDRAGNEPPPDVPGTAGDREGTAEDGEETAAQVKDADQENTGINDRDGANNPEILQIQISDGIMVHLGGSVLRCIKTEGCARGLMSLWMDNEGILFCGDAVGCDHLPPVHMWDSRIDTLGLQFETLRRLRALPVQMILPGRGEPAGIADLLPASGEAFLAGQAGTSSSDRSSKERWLPGCGPSDTCAAVLDDAVAKYCIRILEVYQRVPARGSIPAEQVEGKEPDARSVLSCCKYLLYRRYIRCRETESGEAVYERGNVLLTDWGLQKT